MKVLVIGCGLQGRAAIYDLCKNDQIESIICADLNPHVLDDFMPWLDQSKLSLITLDATKKDQVKQAMEGVDVAIDLAPLACMPVIGAAAVETKTHLVNAMYSKSYPQELKDAARAAGVTILAECGLDPGIDLLTCGKGVSHFDKVTVLHSMTGGIPEQKARDDSPIDYKVTWTWYGVLLSYFRPSRMIVCGKEFILPPEEEFSPKHIMPWNLEGIGQLEAYPNGDAAEYVYALNIQDTIVESSRRTVRWKGLADFWYRLSKLSMLDTNSTLKSTGQKMVDILDEYIAPHIQYKPDEKDLVVMKTIIEGEVGGKKKRLIYEIVDTRDLDTGLFAMNRTTGFTAAIGAQLILSGDITARGVLSTIKDMPFDLFLSEIAKRGIVIRELWEDLE